MASGKPKLKDSNEKIEKQKDTKSHDAIPVSKRIEGVNMIVRFAEADLIGTKKIIPALMRVKGIGHALAGAIVQVSGIDTKKIAGKLTDEEIKKLEDIAMNPMKYGVPSFLVNRRNDPETGESYHKLSSDLIFTKKTDIDNMKKIQCYKGVRHQLGLPVRGQRTRSSFRTGSGVGVVKKKEAPKTAPKTESKSKK